MPIIALSGWKGSGKDVIANYLIQNHKAIRIALADPLKDSVAEEFGIDRSSLDDPKRKELPILSLLVNPKDNFSRMISEFMIKEFRSEDGFVPKGFKYHKEEFYGVFEVLEATGEIWEHPKHMGRDVRSGIHKVYHTPRSLAILKGSTNRSVTSNYWTNKAFGIMEAELDEDPNRLIVITDVRYKSELNQFKERFGDKVTFIRVNRYDKSPSSDPSERDLDNQEFDFYIENRSTLENVYSQMEEIFIRL